MTKEPKRNYMCGRDCYYWKAFNVFSIGRCNLTHADHYQHVIAYNHPACKSSRITLAATMKHVKEEGK